MAKAYVCDDGFFHYCQDFITDKPMHPQFHGKICRFVVGQGIDYYPVQQTRLLLAFRGSWKSTIGVYGFGTWLIGREYVLSAEVRALDERIRLIREREGGSKDSEMSAEEVGDLHLEPILREREVLLKAGHHLEGVNIRIGMQSEALDLAQTGILTCTNIMDRSEWQKYFGTHSQRDRKKGGMWGKTGAISVYRTNAALRDPTLSAISLEQPRIGSHFDVIIADDFQAELSSSSRTMLNKSWHMWKGNYQLLDPPSVSPYAFILAIGTRWHSIDNYGRIIAENTTLAKRDRVEILTLPICRDDGTATCPTIYTTEDIPSVRAKDGIDKFNTQRLLKPIGGKTQPFKKEMIKYHSMRFREEERRDMYAVTAADFCWVEAARRGDSGADHAVVFTALVSPGWSFYLVDVWREQADRKRTLEEVYRQSIEHGSIGQGFSVSDRKHIETDMKHLEHEKGFAFNPTWVSDLKGGAGVDADTAKARKIIGVLQPLFQSGKLYFPIGLQWLEEEILFAPRGTTDDGMDTLVCIVTAAGAPSVARQTKPEKPDGYEWERFRHGLLTGNPVHLDGTPMNPRRRIARGLPRTKRRFRYYG